MSGILNPGSRKIAVDCTLNRDVIHMLECYFSFTYSKQKSGQTWNTSHHHAAIKFSRRMRLYILIMYV